MVEDFKRLINLNVVLEILLIRGKFVASCATVSIDIGL